MAIFKTYNGSDFGKNTNSNRRSWTITLNPDDLKSQANIKTTGKIKTIEISDMINVLQKHYAKLLIKEYVKATGDKSLDNELIDAWLKKQRSIKNK